MVGNDGRDVSGLLARAPSEAHAPRPSPAQLGRDRSSERPAATGESSIAEYGRIESCDSPGVSSVAQEPSRRGPSPMENRAYRFGQASVAHASASGRPLERCVRKGARAYRADALRGAAANRGDATPSEGLRLHPPEPNDPSVREGKEVANRSAEWGRLGESQGTHRPLGAERPSVPRHKERSRPGALLGRPASWLLWDSSQRHTERLEPRPSTNLHPVEPRNRESGPVGRCAAGGTQVRRYGGSIRRSRPNESDRSLEGARSGAWDSSAAKQRSGGSFYDGKAQAKLRAPPSGRPSEYGPFRAREHRQSLSPIRSRHCLSGPARLCSFMANFGY
jgi:hypothetical protein